MMQDYFPRIRFYMIGMSSGIRKLKTGKRVNGRCSDAASINCLNGSLGFRKVLDLLFEEKSINPL